MSREVASRLRAVYNNLSADSAELDDGLVVHMKQQIIDVLALETPFMPLPESERISLAALFAGELYSSLDLQAQADMIAAN